MIKVVRHQDQILLYSYTEHPIVLEHAEALELAQVILNLCGRMSQENDDEALIDVS